MLSMLLIGDSDDAVELAVRLQRERPGADGDRIRAFDMQRLDRDAAAGRLHFAEALGERFWREILKPRSTTSISPCNGLASAECSAGAMADATCSTASITGWLSAEPSMMRA